MHEIKETAASAAEARQIVIRNYRAADFSGLFQLLSKVYGSSITQADLEAHYIGERAEILVAVRDDEVLGCAFLEYQTDYVRERRIVFVSYVAVDESCRHQGIGASLFQEIEARAAARRCSAVELTSAEHRVGAHAFYQRLQFSRKKTTVFIKEL